MTYYSTILNDKRSEWSQTNRALYDFGGTVEELKARCQADTHLEPPVTPVFQKWMNNELAEAAD